MGGAGSRVENRKVFCWKILHLSTHLSKVQERGIQMNIKVLKPETVTCWTLRFLFLQVRKAQIILSKYGTLLAHDSQEKRHRKS